MSHYHRIPNSIPPKYIPRINLPLHIIQAPIIPIRNNRLALCLEVLQIIQHPASKERAAVFQGRFVDDDFRAFGFDTFHHTLDAALPEIVAV